MPRHVTAGGRRWQATVIIALFLVAVVGAAAIGWWYARESPPHQGPIVLIAVDGVPAGELSIYGGPRTDTPAIDGLTADAVVFERAYSHSPQMLPAYASILSGRLPIEHGVRDDAGFTLRDDVRTLAELLRNRGFETGAAVSSFLMRRESGAAQGFSFFDAEIPPGTPDQPAPVERTGVMTIAAAERWVQARGSQRFFLFLQISSSDADVAVSRVTELLKQRGLYDRATIVLTGSRGDVGSGMTLDDTALRVPLLVKQPYGDGAGRRVPYPVQQIDLVPTILDLVRAPLPGGLLGQSLRPVLDDGDAVLDAQPIYSESLTAYYRFGGHPIFALTGNDYRYVRGVEEELVALKPPGDDASGAESAEAGRLRTSLDRLLGPNRIDAPAPPAAGDEDRFALLGYLHSTPLRPDTDDGLTANEERELVEAHREAAVLVGQKKYSAAVRALQAIVAERPMLAAVHFQLGELLERTGRLDEAIQSFRTVRELRPDSTRPALALVDALLRAGQIERAAEEASLAVALAEREDMHVLAAAHGMAARVALSRKDPEAAIAHAEAAQTADPGVPFTEFVRGRLLYDEGRYEDAAAALQKAESALKGRTSTLPELHLYLGETLAQLDRYNEAELQFREELLAFPRSIQAYTSLAMLYRASNRDAAVEDVLNELVASTPTPEGYAVAARLWTILGDRSRAEALRSDARTRFRGDPSLALLGRDGRR